MAQVKSCSTEALPVFAIGKVIGCSTVSGAVPFGSVWYLKVSVSSVGGKDVPHPIPGQFYMLRSQKSGLLLGRPVSVYGYRVIKEDSISVEFLILRKGKGTEELVKLENGDNIELIGPLGNSWPVPEKGLKVACFGGGVGVAPVAGFASSLENGTYDFYAAFKSGYYGLDYIHPANTFITTDDGSVGIKGMITAAIDVEKIKQYDVVYACGPTPMLIAIQKIAKEAKVKCYLSMENRMACGLGACLGCTIKTTQGNKRCCKDGPVFDSEIIDFTKIDSPVTTSKLEKKSPLSENESPDLSVKIAGVDFKNPVIAASGTFGYGQEYSSVFDVNGLGGICSKGLTLEARPGNIGTRLVETPSGLINSIGLENPGIKHFIDNELASMLKFDCVTIANLSGSTLETYVEGAKLLEKTKVPMIELNISCPNVKAGGMAFGMDCTSASSVVGAVKNVITKPLIVKLSPNAPDLIGVAMAVKNAGADAISLVNTFQATSINIDTGRPVFENIRAGFSGPAVKPIALRMVYDLCLAMNKLPENERIPVIGLGGISCWQDAIEFIMAGCTAIQVGTATFGNPYAMKEIIEGIATFMRQKGYKSLDDFRGCAL